MSKHAPKLAWSLGLVLGFTLIAVVVTAGALRIDVALQGDTLSVFAIMRTFLETGAYYASDRLAWPLGMNPTAYPLMNWGTWSIMTLLRPFFAPVDFYPYIVTSIRAVMVASMLSAYWALRVIGSARWIAVLGAISFVAIDFVAVRSFSHFFLIDLFVMPLGLVTVLAIAGRVQLSTPVLLGTAFLAGCGNIYWSFGNALLLAVVLLWLVIERVPRQRLLKAAGVMGALLLPFVVFVAMRAVGDSVDIPSRGPEEQPLYALRYIDAFMPRIPTVTDDGFQTYYERIRAGIGEGDEFVGYLSVLGLACAAFALLAQVLTTHALNASKQLLAVLGILAVFLVIFALPFGLGSAFNVFVSPMMRAHNRLSVPIAFIGIAATCVMATAWRARLKDKGSLWFALPVALLLPLTAFDLTRVWRFPDVLACSAAATGPNCMSQASAQIAPIHKTLTTSGLKAIAIFPVEPFAEAGPSGNRTDYFGFIPHLFAPAESATAFSYGMLRQDPLLKHMDAAEARFAQAPGLTRDEDSPALTALLACVGYDGILVDKVAYNDDGVLAKLSALGATQIAETDHYTLFELDPEVAPQDVRPATCFMPQLKAGAEAPAEIFDQGWHAAEDWGRWGFSRSPNVVWRATTDTAATDLVLGLRGFVGTNFPTREVTVVDGAGTELFSFTATREMPEAEVVIPMAKIAVVEGTQSLFFKTELGQSELSANGTGSGQRRSVAVTRIEVK